MADIQTTSSPKKTPESLAQWRVFIIGHTLVSIIFAIILAVLDGRRLFTDLLPLTYIAALYLAVNGIYYYLWNHNHISFLAVFALGLEIALNTVLIFVLGSEGWVFAFAYLWPIIMGGWLVSPRAVLPLTLAAVLGYAAILVSNTLGYNSDIELFMPGGIPQSVFLALPQLVFVALLLWQFMDRLAANQRELENERNLFDSVLRNMSDAVAVSEDGRYILCNEAAENLLQARVGDVIPSWLLPSEQTEPIRDGTHFVTLQDRVLGINSVKLPECRVWVARNTTEQAQYAQMQSDFVAYASHELRTPLATIKLHIRMLEMDLPPNVPQDSLQTIKHEVDRESRLVNDLLDSARLEAGKFEPHCQNLDVGQLCQQIAERFTPLAQSKGIALILACPEEPVDMFSDMRNIELVLGNLLANAIKFTSEGSIKLECAAHDKEIEFIVEDTGCGMNPEQSAHLFEKYYTAGKPGGTGLGLVIAKMTTEALQGTLTVQSSPGQGTRFSLILPRYLETRTT